MTKLDEKLCTNAKFCEEKNSKIKFTFGLNYSDETDRKIETIFQFFTTTKKPKSKNIFAIEINYNANN